MFGLLEQPPCRGVLLPGLAHSLQAHQQPQALPSAHSSGAGSVTCSPELCMQTRKTCTTPQMKFHLASQLQLGVPQALQPELDAPLRGVGVRCQDEGRQQQLGP